MGVFFFLGGSPFNLQLVISVKYCTSIRLCAGISKKQHRPPFPSHMPGQLLFFVFPFHCVGQRFWQTLEAPSFQYRLASRSWQLKRRFRSRNVRRHLFLMDAQVQQSTSGSRWRGEVRALWKQMLFSSQEVSRKGTDPCHVINIFKKRENSIEKARGPVKS